jgi:hypothetical protein
MLQSDMPNLKIVCDNGIIYKANDWERLGDTNKSYHYLDTQLSRVIHKTVWDMN